MLLFNNTNRQELVFIGTNLNKESIIADLQSCLLTEDEVAMGRDGWSVFEDPFPASNSDHGHSHSHEHGGMYVQYVCKYVHTKCYLC